MHFSPFIQNSLTEVAEIARQNFGSISEVNTKENDNNQVLTETDIAIGAFLVQKIQKNFPSHNIIDEEAGVIDNGGEYTWVVDPIDGTSNFANGLPTYGSMIGLLHGSEAIAGGVVLPEFDQLYLGEKGQGATCNGTKIQVSKEQSLLKSLIAYGIDGHQEAPQKTHEEVGILAKIILNIRNLRTTNSAYDMVQVPAGKYGAFLNQTTKIWDNVAIQPIVEEAGGVVTDFWGKPLIYENALIRSQENFTICAGAPALHAKLQEIIHAQ
ncbi:MAG: inositol monophosphatase [Microgenomates group bacterium]